MDPQEQAVHSDPMAIIAVGPHFGVSSAPILTTRPLKNARFSVEHVTCSASGTHARTINLPPQPCYFMMLYLRDAEHCDIMAGGLETVIRRYRAASVCLVDLQAGATIRLHSDLDALAFRLPYDLFHDIGGMPHAPEASPLRCLRGSSDKIMWNIGSALMPLFRKRDADMDMDAVLSPIAIAICTHLLHHYEDRAKDSSGPMLSQWQEKEAKEFMADNIGLPLGVDDIAARVGMEPQEFAKAFIATLGMTPQQWLTHFRLDQAMECLGDSDLTIMKIAQTCGFSQESEFSDVFARHSGMTPQAWRTKQFQ